MLVIFNISGYDLAMIKFFLLIILVIIALGAN